MEYAVTYKIRDAGPGRRGRRADRPAHGRRRGLEPRGAVADREPPAGTGAAAAGLAVAEIDYVDTSGEVIDQSADHRRRLRAFEASLRSDLTASGKLRSVALDCPPNACSVGDLDDRNWCKAQAAGADLSPDRPLSQDEHAGAMGEIRHDRREGAEAVFDRLVTFRGDNDEAWRRAESFIVRQIMDRERIMRPRGNSPSSIALICSARCFEPIRHCARPPAMNHRPGWPVRVYMLRSS